MFDANRRTQVRIAIAVMVAVLVVLALWRGAEAQTEASAPCWDVEHGPIGWFTRIQDAASGATLGSRTGDGVGPERWESVLINRCTGETWTRRGIRWDTWEPISREEP